jgi:hypothetical protein
MIEGISLVQLTPPALLGLCILFIITGRLVPRFFYNEKVKSAERWRAAYEAERQARMLSDSQTRELLEVAKTSKQFLSALVESTIVESGEG